MKPISTGEDNGEEGTAALAAVAPGDRNGEPEIDSEAKLVVSSMGWKRQRAKGGRVRIPC